MDKKTFKQKLVEARKNITNPERGGNDAFKKRKYVTLQDLYDVAIPALLAEGLLLINKKEQRECGYCLVTQILDADSNEFIETIAILNDSLKIQDQGSELTYHSRYNLSCLLSIRTDFDDDGESIKDIEKNNKVISASQVEEIGNLINNDKQAWGMIEKQFKVEKVSAIPSKEFSNVVTRLKLYNQQKENQDV